LVLRLWYTNKPAATTIKLSSEGIAHEENSGIEAVANPSRYFSSSTFYYLFFLSRSKDKI